MKWIFAVLALFSAAASAGENSVYRLDGSYGTLTYTGTVNRAVGRESVVFEVEELHLSFDPEAAVNSTTEVVSPTVRVVTTLRDPEGGKATITYEARIPTSVRLDAKNRKVVLRGLTFTVPKSAFDSADYAGLGVTDGRMLWPIHQDLRH